MAIGVDDVIEVVLQGTFNGAVGLRNVFHFQVSNVDVGGDTPFEQMYATARDVWANMLDELRAITSAVVSYSQITAKVISGAEAGVQNLYLIPTGERAGLASGDALPPYVAYGFRYQGAGGAERNGYKRFAGVNEGNNQHGAYAGDAALVNDLATKLAADIQISGFDSIVGQYDIQPVIIKKMAGGLDPSDILVIAKWRPVGVTFYGLTTQNTRKFGRGI